MSKDGRGVGGRLRCRSRFYHWIICHRTGNDSDISVDVVEMEGVDDLVYHFNSRIGGNRVA